MKPGGGCSNGSWQFFERTVNGLRHQMSAQWVCKNQILAVPYLSCWAGLKPPLSLPCFLMSENIYYKGRQGEFSASAVLRRIHPIDPCAGSVLVVGELFVNKQRPLFKIHTVPGQGREPPPFRRPVNSVTTKTASYGCPFTADKNRVIASSSSTSSSLRLFRGKAQGSAGLNRRYPIATACWSAL